MAAASSAALDRLFQALTDPTRRAILSALLAKDRTVAELAAPFGISLTAVSKHIGLLEGAGLLRVEKAGRARWCRIDPAALAPAFAWLRTCGYDDTAEEEALERRLERLGLAAEGNAEAGPV